MLKAIDFFGVITYIDNAEIDKSYFCQICKQKVFQKRGDIKIHHFSHYSSKGAHYDYTPCLDDWNYDSSDWHIDWQKRFEYKYIESVVEVNNEKHIADILTDNIVVEFQHNHISIEDFRKRNEFFSLKGYRVIWVVDVTQQYDDEKIEVDDKKDNCYHWINVKKLFKDMDIEKEKATIYFQFSNSEDEDDGVLERVTKSNNCFKTFFTDAGNSLSISEFIEKVKNNDESLFENDELLDENKTTAPDEIEGGETIYDLWKEKYSGMRVKNLFNDKVMVINGRNGRMHRNKDDPTKIIGRYCVKNNDNNFYNPKGKYYNVWDANKAIWKLMHAFIDGDFEKRQQRLKEERERALEEAKRKEMEENYYNSFPENVNNGKSLTYLKFINKEKNMIVKNLVNNKSYVLDFVDENLTLCNAYEIDENTGEKASHNSNKELSNLSSKWIWQKI